MSGTESITEARPGPSAQRHSSHVRLNVEQASYAYSARKQAAPLFTLEATTFQAGLDELIAWSERQNAVDRVEASFAELERQGLVR